MRIAESWKFVLGIMDFGIMDFVYLAPWKVMRIAESWKFLLGIMDFGIRNPANYKILESRPFEIWNTLSWNPESSICNAGCGVWNLRSEMVSD